MDSKLVLLQSIMLLYWESRLENNKEGSGQFIHDIVVDIEPSETILESDPSRDILMGLKSTCLWLCAQEGKEEKLDADVLKQRIKMATHRDPSVGELIVEGFEGGNTEEEIKQKCLSYSRHINEYRQRQRFVEQMREYTRKVVYGNPDDIDVRSMANEIQVNMETFTTSAVNEGVMSIAGVMGMVDFHDEDSVSEMFQTAIDETGLDGIIKTGYQDINNMLGHHQGFRRGDFWTIGAMQHNWKTGFTLNLTRHAAQYNKPFMLDPEKKPLILHVSAENALTDNVLLMYQYLIENETGKAVDLTDIDQVEATKYIMEKTSVNGYHLQMLRVNPSEFAYRDLFDLVTWYESEGYEIHFMCTDYLNMLNKAGCVQGPTGSDTRDLFRRVRNFTTARKITFMTPHQISSDAKYLLRQGVEDIVKELAGKSYWDSCKTIDQEVDGAMICHIEKYANRFYFTVQLDKHRKSGPITPEEHKYAVLPMYPVGAVRDDLHLEKSQGLKKVGADVTGGGDDWFNAA